MTVVTIFVEDMDRAVHFYASVLNMKLEHRFGNEWASLKTEDGVTFGLHPASKESPAGRRGSITIGFEVKHSIQETMTEMKQKGVKFVTSIQDDKQVKAANFQDPDGNEMYLVEVQPEWQEKEHPKAV